MKASTVCSRRWHINKKKNDCRNDEMNRSKREPTREHGDACEEKKTVSWLQQQNRWLSQIRFSFQDPQLHQSEPTAASGAANTSLGDQKQAMPPSSTSTVVPSSSTTTAIGEWKAGRHTQLVVSRQHAHLGVVPPRVPPHTFDESKVVSPLWCAIEFPSSPPPGIEGIQEEEEGTPSATTNGSTATSSSWEIEVGCYCAEQTQFITLSSFTSATIYREHQQEEVNSHRLCFSDQETESKDGSHGKATVGAKRKRTSDGDDEEENDGDESQRRTCTTTRRRETKCSSFAAVVIPLHQEVLTRWLQLTHGCGSGDDGYYCSIVFRLHPPPSLGTVEYLWFAESPPLQLAFMAATATASASNSTTQPRQSAAISQRNTLLQQQQFGFVPMTPHSYTQPGFGPATPGSGAPPLVVESPVPAVLERPLPQRPPPPSSSSQSIPPRGEMQASMLRRSYSIMRMGQHGNQSQQRHRRESVVSHSQHQAVVVQTLLPHSSATTSRANVQHKGRTSSMALLKFIQVNRRHREATDMTSSSFTGDNTTQQRQTSAGNPKESLKTVMKERLRLAIELVRACGGNVSVQDALLLIG